MATRKTAAPTVATPKKAPRRERTRLAAKVDWRPAFLADLAEWCNVTHACAAAGVDRKTAYKDRANNPDFAAAWDDAIEASVELLEQRARERAVDQSDTLMIFLLKAHRPERYRERREIEHSGKGGGPIEIRSVTIDLSADAARVETDVDE